MAIVRIRLVADTATALDEALADIEDRFGGRVQLTRPRWRGRRGEWLAYGTLRTCDSPLEDGDERVDGEPRRR